MTGRISHKSPPPLQAPPWAVIGPRGSGKADDAERPHGAPSSAAAETRSSGDGAGSGGTEIGRSDKAPAGRNLRRASTERAVTMDALPSVLPADAGYPAEQRSPDDSLSPWPATDFSSDPFAGRAAAEPANRPRGLADVPRCMSFDGYRPRAGAGAGAGESQWASSPWGRAYLEKRSTPKVPRGPRAVRGSLSAGAGLGTGSIVERVVPGKGTARSVQI